MNPFSRLARALWELKHVQYERDIVRWAGFTKYVIYRKRGAFDSAHAYTLTVVIVGYQWLSLVISGHLWLSVVIVGYSWLLLVIGGYPWLFLVISDYCW